MAKGIAGGRSCIMNMIYQKSVRRRNMVHTRMLWSYLRIPMSGSKSWRPLSGKWQATAKLGLFEGILFT